MKRYRLIYHGLRDTFYNFDTHTGKRESLGSNDLATAQRLLAAKNEAVQHIEMNLQIAQISAPIPMPVRHTTANKIFLKALRISCGNKTVVIRRRIFRWCF